MVRAPLARRFGVARLMRAVEHRFSLRKLREIGTLRSRRETPKRLAQGADLGLYRGAQPGSGEQGPGTLQDRCEVGVGAGLAGVLGDRTDREAAGRAGSQR